MAVSNDLLLCLFTRIWFWKSHGMVLNMQEIRLQDLIYIKRNALTADQCQLLIEEYESRSKESVEECCLHAVTDTLTTSTFKRIELIPRTKNFDLVHSTTNAMITDWITHLDQFQSFHIFGLKRSLRFSHMHRLMKYQENEWIHPHVDWDELIHASCTISLNSNYSGGEFKFWNGRYTVQLNQGDAMIWPADPFWVHEVTPVTNGCRYSTNTFIQSLPFDERNHLSDQIWQLGYSRQDNKYFYNQCLEKFKK